ncbi:MAG: serine/threonine protein phosphatase [Pseudanabaena sp.]|nr:MAG: serine/threonine protein phosphatase [Pseudanabaena sp.]
MKLSIKNSRVASINYWIENLVIAAIYFLVSALVLKLPQSQLGSPVWPPAGLAVGALLARGRSRWWGIFLGATLNSFINSKVPFHFAVFAGLTPAIGALVSMSLVVYFNKTNDFLGYVKHFVVFVLAVTFSGTLVQAVLGTLIVFWAGLIPWDIFGDVVWGWWVGDAIGVLLFTPLIYAWCNKQPKIDSHKQSFNKLESKELILCLLTITVIFYLILIKSQPIEYFLLPPLLWSAFRFGAKITTLITTVVAMTAAVSTAYKLGIFYKVSQESNSLIFLQLFMGVMVVTTIAVLALVAENDRASEKLLEQVILKDKAYTQLDQVNKNLEDIIDERTKELKEANQEINSLNQQLTLENYRMSSELAVTRKLQEMILPRPKELNSIKELDIVGFMEPADEVGGDYYDVLQRDGRIKIGIGDVTGHGLESGVIMIMLQTAIRTLLINGESNPVKFLSTINQTIYENLQRMNCDKSLSLILMDYHDSNLYISGQHESVIVVRANGEIEIIDTDALGFPIGLTDEITEFVFELEIHLDLGDLVLLYTDGIPEAENKNKQYYGLDRLIQLISESREKPIESIREIVISDVREFIGSNKVHDDITFVVMKRKI